MLSIASFCFSQLLLLLLLCTKISCINEPKCPTWHWYNYSSGKCECGDGIMNTIECQENESVLARFDVCLSVDCESRSVIRGTCKYKTSHSYVHRVYSKVPPNPQNLTSAQCDESHREGLFCGRCKQGYAPSLGITDSMCIECSTCLQNPVSLLQFVLAEILPLTAFYIIIMGAHINIVSGPMLGYVLFCQGHINTMQLYPNVWRFIFARSGNFVQFWNLKLLPALAGIWNLNFFAMFLHNVCCCCGLSNLTLIVLEYFSVVYIFLLLFFSYYASTHNMGSKCLQCNCLSAWFSKWRQNWSVSDSTIHALATFTGLLCAKVGAISTKLLSATQAVNMNGTFLRHVVTFEPTIDKLSSHHTPFIIAAYIPIFMLVIIPSIILCLYPNRHFQSILRHCCGPRKRLALGNFVDTICSGYRDGLDGGRDYRRLYPLSLLVILASLFLLANFSSSLPETYFILLLPVFLFLSFFTMYLRPCKTGAMNASLGFHLIMMGLSALIVALWIQDSFLNTQSLEIALIFFLTLPHVVMLLWFMSVVVRHCGFLKNCYERARHLVGRSSFPLQRF